MSGTPAQEIDTHRGIIAWFARNPVAANLLMALIIVVGLYSVFNIKRTVMPEFVLNLVSITMIYPGAAPEEVERGLVMKIEEALKDIEAIKRIDATASESLASLQIEIHDDYDVLVAMDEIKSAVDGITSFPQEAERPVINQVRMREHAINVQVYGDLDERTMKNLVEEVREEMLREPDIAYVTIFGARDDEIAIEVSEATLRQYNLTLDQVAAAIRASSLDLPGGSIRTPSGDIMLRARGQAYDQHAFERVVLLTHADGTRLYLGDVATVRDGFVEQDGFSMFNGRFGMAITVYAVGNQDLITVARAARDYVERKRPTLPEGVSIDYWADITYYLEGRLQMMLGNLALGALLVFIVLSLFLDIKLAFWVMAGLPLCFLGAFALLPLDPIDVSINMISLFGFILVLGIVVDDAIIIGESAYSETERKGHSVDAIIEGARRVAVPATFGVLTTIVAFSPTLFSDGVFAPFPAACGWVVILCLVFSLIESKWILPAHLAHSPPGRTGIWLHLNSAQRFCNTLLALFIDTVYRPAIRRCIERRYLTAASFLAMLVLTAGLVAGGVVRYVLVPHVPGDFVRADLQMVEGTAEQQTRAAYQRMQAALHAVNEDYRRQSSHGEGFVEHVFSWGADGRRASFMVELTRNEARSLTADDISQRWRDAIGEIPGAEVLSISSADDMGGPALGFKLVGRDMAQLELAARELEAHLATYNGVYDIRNGASAVRDEIVLGIRPEAEAVGLTLSDLATQVRHAFYGAEAQRVQRGNEEVRVMVRYPEEQRRHVADLENMEVRTPQGYELPFSAVAVAEVEPGFSRITRIDGERAITVSAEADKNLVEPSRILNSITSDFMPQLQQQFPGVSYRLDGESEEAAKLFTSLFTGFALALLGIYALLAIPLKSYLQPLIIMGVIPFGIIGAIVGHIIVGIPFDMMSFFGVIALSGVVVNDSLIMVDFVNRARAAGQPLLEAVVDAGSRRYRAIMLTSLTTFFGLLPMLLESSLQAQLVLPMAVSLAFGIIFATVITLLLIPCLYMILDDFRTWFGSDTRKLAATAA